MTIMNAVERFREEFGRDPTSHDFQYTDYLPDPETIRRLYGGLPLFRKKFAFDVEDYTKGKVRSDLNRSLNDRAKVDEEKILDFLVAHFGEICVHKEREFAYRNRVDFQVYYEGGIFGVDTFFPKNRAALVNIFNLKYTKYIHFLVGPIYLVCMNPHLTQVILDDYVLSRKNNTISNIRLMSEVSFLEEIKKYSRRTSI